MPEGSTATDLVLTVTQMLRKKGVVGKFVEFYGSGVAALPLADRATIGNMAPEYGATIGFFPIDHQTLDYLRLSNRPPELIALVEAYAKAQGLFLSPDSPEPEYSDTLELDLSTVVPSLAGPKRPQDRINLPDVKKNFLASLAAAPKTAQIGTNGSKATIHDGSVVIAAITSCTNTSNPSVMVAAGLLAKKAVEKGLKTQPWVKIEPGARLQSCLRLSGRRRAHAVSRKAAVQPGRLRLHHLHRQQRPAARTGRRSGAKGKAGGGRRAERQPKFRRPHQFSGARELPGLAAAGGRLCAGRPRGHRSRKTIPSEPIKTEKMSICGISGLRRKKSHAVVKRSVRSEMFQKQYAEVFQGDARWNSVKVPAGDLYEWSDRSTYIRKPPYFDNMVDPKTSVRDFTGLRVLALLGDSVTTDHISPAGSIPVDSPAGKYLIGLGVKPGDFNSYGARRGNHEVMVRGTLANIRLRNLLAPGTEGGWTTHVPSGEKMFIYDAALKYQKEGTPLAVIAGKEYGSGSSRDWAAKGTLLLGVKRGDRRKLRAHSSIEPGWHGRFAASISAG